MKLTLEMAAVNTCEATRCAYNVNHSCRARAITIGGGTHPACDTYITADRDEHVAPESDVAGVGACKVTSCRFNDNLECGATAIAVAHHWRHADCTTYDKR